MVRPSTPLCGRFGLAARSQAARPSGGTDSIGELLLDGGEVDPGALPADQAVAEVEDVQKPRPHRPAAPLEPERPTLRRSVQDRLVDDVVVAIPASDRLEAFDPKLREQASIEVLDLVAAVEWVAGAPGDVVLGVDVNPSTIASRSPASSAR